MQHDACGVGFVADLGRRASHAIVEHGLTALCRLAHRGAPAHLGAVDGCGVMTAIPWPFVAAAAGRLPDGRSRALGMLFVDADCRARTIDLVARELERAGAHDLVWRDVPTDPAAVLPAQRSTAPSVLQVAAGFARGPAALPPSLYLARLRIEAAARRDSLPLTVVSLSAATVVYKGLLTPDALPRFYPDLLDVRVASPFVVFHQRFSTNTSADWALAQPFRTIAHNGEINTIAGNRAWMRARLADPSSLPLFAAEDGLAPVAEDGSDSRTLDDAIELMRHQGYSIVHALARLVPPAWERERDLAPDIRAFYEFQALLGEPWDGPSALAFADGRFVGAAMDRNGFRPFRCVRTAAGLIAVASEVGVLAADEHDIIDRSRLGPGDVLLVDLERGAVMATSEVRRRLAYRRPYRRMVDDVVRPLPPEAEVFRSADASRLRNDERGASLLQRQIACGCSREEIQLILRPMADAAHEAVGSMGDDAPPAVLSARPRLFSDFFRQRFAQVTNPPIDPYRESSVMSLTTRLGGQGPFLDEIAPRPARLVLRSPILSRDDLLRVAAADDVSPVFIDATFRVDGGVEAFEAAVDRMAAEACAAVTCGCAVVILTDRGVNARFAAVPALLAVSAVHHALIAAGLRLRCSVVVDSGDARDTHQAAVLCAYGAAALCPTLAYDTIDALELPDAHARQLASARYRLALERGLLTVMSKMGVCTFSSYCGAQLFEALGLDLSLVDRFFPGTSSPVGGVTLGDVARATLERHRRAFAAPEPALEHPGLHTFRRDGEYHATNPLVVRSLQTARSDGDPAYATFLSHVYNRPPAAIRDLLEFVAGDATPIARVEPAEDICRRFFASAMSVGALSPEAHRMVARAMNRLGARSNSGEGGEEPDRFGTDDGNRTKQVASARFGVTPAYLRSADELQIKIAQGSKPGEGGQLPAAKVVAHIATLRHAQPGTPLISPPVHHDIYSIEDLAQLVFDLRTFHPRARINVKLVASSGVGIIAVGVAKAGADAIQISGHDGGTGASPRGSIKHAGMPWEIGVSDAHRALIAAGLRRRVALQTDGGLKTGRDIAVAAALGADEYGFGTAALVALGCVMARQCHANTCPVGVATQREDLRLQFAGTADMLVSYLMLVASEVRGILARVGLARLADLVGRTDLLRRRADVSSTVDVSGVLRHAPSHECAPTPNPQFPIPNPQTPIPNPQPPLPGPRLSTADRAVGAAIAGEIAAAQGDAGLPEGSVCLAFAGSAGQSFGAFAVPGMRLALVGDANDGVGKGMHGGEIVIAAAARERGRARQVLAGNAVLYGATGGRLFIAGVVGERFAVRNSGAVAVVEGAGDHACEYMTGGTVVVLGAVGRNFGAGMTGGVAFVLDRRRRLAARTSGESLIVESLQPADRQLVTTLLRDHERLTGSREARSILRHDSMLTSFVRVAPAVAAATERQAVAEERAVNE